jgi:MFS family permease
MSVIGQELKSSKKALGDVIANQALRRLFYAFAGSIIGDGVFTLSAVVYVFLHGGPTAVGVLAFVRYLSMAMVTPFTSALADQFDRRSVMVISDIIRMVLVSLAAVLVGVHASRWSIFVIIVLVGLAGTAFRPAQASILPLLARESDEIAGANVVSSTIESVGFFGGPALAGFLLAFTFVWSALLLASMRPPRPEERSPELVALWDKSTDAGQLKAQSFLVRAEQGFRIIAHDREVLTLVGLYVLQCVVAGASAVFTVSIALHLLHIGSSGLGLMESTLGIGGLVGGFIALMLASRARMATDFGLGVMVWAAPLLLIAVFPDLGAVLISMWLIGAANSVVDVNAITVLQHMVPNDKLGRVLGALEAGEVAGMAIGSLAMTLLIHVTGLRIGLAIIGSVVTLLVIPGIPALRRIDKTVFADGIEHLPRSAHGHRHFLRVGPRMAR